METKKNYMKPESEELKMNIKGCLLAGSTTCPTDCATD